MGLLFCCCSLLIEERDLHLEYGAAAGRIMRRQTTAEIGHDTGGDREAEPRPVPRFLRRIERFKKIVQILDPMAVVAHRKGRRLPGREEDVYLRLAHALRGVQRVAKQV